MPVIIRNGKVYGGVPTVDTELLLDSTNPVENRAIAEAIQEIKDSEIPHWIGTREEYDAAIEAGEIEDGSIIIITDEPDVDNLPTENSTNLVYSGGVWTALQAKQDVFQVAELPTANEDEVGKIYQFIGTTDTNYTNGYFYECVEDSTTDPATYAWVRKDVQPFGEVVKYVDTLPTGNNIEDVIYGLRNYSNVVSKLTSEGFLDDDTNFEYNNNVYTAVDGVEIQSSTDGVTWSDFISLTFADPDFNLVQADGTYPLVSGTDTFYYRTVKREFYVGDSDRETTYKISSDEIEVEKIQYSVVPTAGAEYLNKVIQYVGETDSNFIKGFFYRCVSIPDTDPTEYEWVNQEVQESTDGEAKVNAIAVTSLSGLADGFYLLIDSTATPIYQLKEIADGTATDSNKEVDTCLIDYVLYNDNKTVLDTLDIVWVVTGTPDVSDYKTEFETAKSDVRRNADYTFEWDSDVFSVGDFADLKSRWNDFAVFMHNNKGRLAIITIDQCNFGFSDDDTGGSSPTLICIIPDEVSIGEDYSIRIPYGSATGTHCDGYGFGFIDINWRLNISLGKCELAGINTILFKGTDSMSTGYAYTSSGATSVCINEEEYSMNDATERATAYNLYHQGVSIMVKLL